MFVVKLKYLKPLELVDQYLVQHRDFLEEGYKKGFFLASGPQNPRVGGIIIALIKTREELEAVLKQDPFCVEGLASYELIEFTPVKYHPLLTSLVSPN
jgi:uncharacterized protein YciI